MSLPIEQCPKCGGLAEVKGWTDRGLVIGPDHVNRLARMVEAARECRCICGLYEWTEDDCPACCLHTELDRIAGGGE